MSTFEQTRQIIGEVLQLGNRTQQLEKDTVLMGNIPEFDSMAVVSLIAALEENFGFMATDDEIDAVLFETVGSVSDFVEQKMAAA
jgi:acyl carrier protein